MPVNHALNQYSSLTNSFSFPQSNKQPNLDTRNTSLPTSFAEVVRSAPYSHIVKRNKSKKIWIDGKRGKSLCFRCGGNHLAKHCSDPIRCFVCGKFGHRKFGRTSKLNRRKSTPVSTVNHGFQFALKFLLLNGLLLDNLSQKKHECLKFLDELFIHFDDINAPNIDKRYRARFGDPEIYFGKSKSKYTHAKPIPNPSLMDHRFQFGLKFLILRGLLLDNLWQLREEGHWVFGGDVQTLRRC